MYDANGDGYDDLTCHTSTGIIQISESHIVELSKFGFLYCFLNCLKIVKRTSELIEFSLNVFC